MYTRILISDISVFRMTCIYAHKWLERQASTTVEFRSTCALPLRTAVLYVCYLPAWKPLLKMSSPGLRRGRRTDLNGE